MNETLNFVAKVRERSGSMVVTIPSSITKYEGLEHGRYVHVSLRTTEKKQVTEKYQEPVERMINTKTGDIIVKKKINPKTFSLFKKDALLNQ